MALPPVIWKPSPNFGYPTVGARGRMGHKPLAEVKHRIVGTLASADGRFLNSKGGASSHFGIGYINGQLSIHQYVDLGDAAWTNGDAREPSWPLYQSGVNPNLTTITTEHEDGGTAGRGIVTEPVWQASIALSALLRSGSVDSIRGAGIHLSDRAGLTASQLVTQVAAWPIDATRYIDHHQIAGPNKPYCFRHWLDDPGFVDGSPSRRDELLAALSGLPDSATEDDPLDWSRDIRPVKPFRFRVANTVNVYDRPELSGLFVTRQLAPGSSRVAVGSVKGPEYPPGSGNTTWDAWATGNGWRCIPSATHGEVTQLSSDSGISQAELDEAVAEARADGITDAAAAAAAVT